MRFNYLNCSIIKKMERTSIFAHSNKLILPSFTDQKCPNCCSYQKQINVLKSSLTQIMKQMQISRPLLKELSQNSNIINYEDQLILLKKQYQNLQKKLDSLDQENQELLEENQRLGRENRNLKKQIASFANEKNMIKRKNQEKQCIYLEEVKNFKEKENRFCLTEITNCQTNKTSRTHKKNQEIEEIEESYDDFREYVKRREKIQIQRHQQIQRIKSLLQEV